MAADLNIPLTPEEFASLAEMDEGLLERVIPQEHRDKLISAEFIEQKLGGLALTDAGRMRLARGK